MPDRKRAKLSWAQMSLGILTEVAFAVALILIAGGIAIAVAWGVR